MKKSIVTIVLALTLVGCNAAKQAGGPPLTTEIVGTWRVVASDPGGANPVVIIANLKPIPTQPSFGGCGTGAGTAGAGDACFLDQAPVEVSGTFIYPLFWVSVWTAVDPAPGGKNDGQGALVTGWLMETDHSTGTAQFDLIGHAPGTTPAIITGQWSCDQYTPVCQGEGGTFIATKQ